MYNHFAITVTTARNSGMIGLGWLTGCAFDSPRPFTKKGPQRLWPPLQEQSLPMWVVAVLIGQRRKRRYLLMQGMCTDCTHYYASILFVVSCPVCLVMVVLYDKPHMYN